MKLKTKIYLDKIFGFPAVSFLDHISKMMLLVRYRKKQDNINIERIAVCKFMGMGSIIQSTPLLITIRKRYPSAEITFITLPKNINILKTFPFVDKIRTIDDRSILTLIITFLKFLLSQWVNKIDILIDLEVHSYFSRILTALSFSKYKFGFYKKESNIQLGIYSKMAFYNTKAPVHKIYLQAAYLLGCNDFIEDLYDWNSVIKEIPASLIWQSLGSTCPEKGYIVINPNASDLRIERRWGQSNFVHLINTILCKYPELKIILTGSYDEMQYVGVILNGIKEEFHTKVVNSSGRLTLKELIVLINGCSIMITNDSGPMHIAFALRKYTIALFGPCSPQDYITNHYAYFVYKNLYCSPCVHHFAISPCNGDNRCMKMISIDEVLKAVNEIMGNKIQWSSSDSSGRILYNSNEEDFAFGVVERKL